MLYVLGTPRRYKRCHANVNTLHEQQKTSQRQYRYPVLYQRHNFRRVHTKPRQTTPRSRSCRSKSTACVSQNTHSKEVISRVIRLQLERRRSVSVYHCWVFKKLDLDEHISTPSAHVCPDSQQILDDAKQKPTTASISEWYLTDWPSTVKKPPAPLTPYVIDPITIPAHIHAQN